MPKSTAPASKACAGASPAGIRPGIAGAAGCPVSQPSRCAGRVVSIRIQAPAMPVRQLPEAVINRIAAGEVVERPASAVKELIENALDAGARKIDLLTDGGGRRLVRIADDGAGMTAEDAKLSLE